MVPKDFRKPLCIAAGCVTLVVSVLWELASIFSIGVYNCTWNFFGIDKGVTTWSMLYITYFMGGCKSTTDASTIGFDFTPPSSAANNLQIWMWIYTVATTLWIPACVLLIVAAMNEVRGKAGAGLYYPWISLTAVLIILDLAGAIYHLVDVFSTKTADDYAKFTQSTDWDTLAVGAASSDIISWLPSLYLTLFFSRFLVLWLLNIYFVFSVYKASSAVSLYKTKYLQSTVMTEEKRKTWKDKFFQGPDPREFGQQKVNIPRRPILNNVREQVQEEAEMQERKPPRSPSFVPGEKQMMRRRPSVSSYAASEPSSSSHSPVRYRLDEFGIPIEELNSSEPREISYNINEGHLPRSPLQTTGRVFDYTGRPLTRPEPYSERRQDPAPPVVSGVEVPPQLNRNRPFSYMAGDQPQLLKKIVSRSNSKADEYPVIPRPDYTIAVRRTPSLEYVPHRFKLPSPNQPEQFKYDSPSTSSRSPTSPRRAPVPPRKPQNYSRAPLKPQPQEYDEITTDAQTSRYAS